MMEGFKRRQQRKLAERFLESDQAEALLTILTTIEDEQLAAVEELHDELGIEFIDERPTPEDRAELLRAMALAQMGGEFPAFWVRHCSGLDNADEAAEVADLDADGWADQRATWAASYREASMEGTDRQLVEGHVRRRFGVPLDRFRELVVDWPAGRVAEEMQALVASGAETVTTGIELATEAVRDDELGGGGFQPSEGIDVGAEGPEP